LQQEVARKAVEMLTSLVRVTSELFGGEVTINEDFDPEYPEHRYLVVEATTRLPPKEIVQQERKWIEALLDLGLPPIVDIRLSPLPLP